MEHSLRFRLWDALAREQGGGRVTGSAARGLGKIKAFGKHRRRSSVPEVEAASTLPPPPPPPLQNAPLPPATGGGGGGAGAAAAAAGQSEEHQMLEVPPPPSPLMPLTLHVAVGGTEKWKIRPRTSRTSG
jgi:hypothetical protein